MKSFEELNEREEKTKNHKKIRTFISKKNISTLIICIILAFALALFLASKYTSYQRKRLIGIQEENASLNYQITFEFEKNAGSESVNTSDRDNVMSTDNANDNLEDAMGKNEEIDKDIGKETEKEDVQVQEEKKIEGFINGKLSDSIRVKYSNYKETKSYIEFYFVIENLREEDVNIKFWYESNINNYTLTMSSLSEISSYTIPANGSALMNVRYDIEEIQYCGIYKIDKIWFLVGNAEDDRAEGTQVFFEDLGIILKDNLIQDSVISNRIHGELSRGEMSAGINIDFVGYNISKSYISLYFDVENISKKYYGFTFWYASQINKCALKMRSTSDISGRLDGNDHVLLVLKYSLDDLRNAGIYEISELNFRFANNTDNKDNAASATFYDLNIPVE